jgi:Ca2+-binding EF-hand superfamily protein
LQKFDPENEGQISHKEFIKVLNQEGISLSMDEFKKLAEVAVCKLHEEQDGEKKVWLNYNKIGSFIKLPHNNSIISPIEERQRPFSNL